MGDNDFFVGVITVLAVFVFLEVIGWIEYNRDDIYPQHIEQALEVCSANDGLKRIDGELGGSHEFHCNNGAMFMFSYKAKVAGTEG